MGTVHPDFWCERVRTCFSTFVANPRSLHHLLLFGPPGSGKTTSAQWLVQQIWGKQKSLMCISMNAADERSLEAIRQKIFPFLRASWATLQTNKGAPRFIILDECETLTDAAQLSLQTILDRDPNDVCVILICNSQSRIHPKLRQRLLRIRYDPPATSRLSPQHPLEDKSAFHEMTRGDLRCESRRPETEQRLWFYLNAHPEEIRPFLETAHVDMHTILTEILLLMNLLYILDETILTLINHALPLATTGLFPNKMMDLVETILTSLKVKFEERNAPPLR